MKKEAVFLTDEDDTTDITSSNTGDVMVEIEEKTDKTKENHQQRTYSGTGDFQFITNRGRLQMKKFSKWPISPKQDAENFIESIPKGYVTDIVKKTDYSNFSRFVARHYEWLLLSIRPLSTPLYSDVYVALDFEAYDPKFYNTIKGYHDYLRRFIMDYYNSPEMRDRFKRIEKYDPEKDEEVQKFQNSTKTGLINEIENLIKEPMKKEKDSLREHYMKYMQPVIFALVELFGHAAMEFAESAIQVMKATYKREGAITTGQMRKMEDEDRLLQLGDLPYEILQHILILAAPKTINIMEFMDMVHINVQDKIPAPGCFFVSLEPLSDDEMNTSFKLMFYYNDFDFDLIKANEDANSFIEYDDDDDDDTFSFGDYRKRVDMTPILKVMSFTSAIVYAVNEYLKYPERVSYHLVSGYSKSSFVKIDLFDRQWYAYRMKVSRAKWYTDATKNVPMSSVLSIGRKFTAPRSCEETIHLPLSIAGFPLATRVIRGKWNGYADRKIFGISNPSSSSLFDHDYNDYDGHDDDDDDDYDVLIEDMENKTRNISLVEGKAKFTLVPRRKGRDSPYKKKDAMQKKRGSTSRPSPSLNIYAYKHENMLQQVIYIDQGKNKYEEMNYDADTGELKEFQTDQRNKNFTLPVIKNKKKFLYSLRHDIKLVPELSVVGAKVYRGDGNSDNNGESPSLKDLIREFIFPHGEFSKFFDYRLCLKKGSYKDIFGDERKLGDPTRLTKMKQLEFYPPIMETDISYFEAENFSMGPRNPYDEQQYGGDMKSSSNNKYDENDEDIMCGYFMDSEYILRRNYSYRSHFIKMAFSLDKLNNFMINFDEDQLRNEAKSILLDSLLNSDEDMSADDYETIKKEYMNGKYEALEDFLFVALKEIASFIPALNDQGMNSILYEYFSETPTSVLDSIEYYLSDEFIKKHIDRSIENAMGNIDVYDYFVGSSFISDYDLYPYRLFGYIAWKMINKYRSRYSPSPSPSPSLNISAHVYVEMRLPLMLKLKSILDITKEMDNGMDSYNLDQVKDMIRSSHYIRMSSMFDKGAKEEEARPIILTCTTVLVPLEDIKKYMKSKTSGNRKNPTFLDLYLLNYQEDLIVPKEERINMMDEQMQQEGQEEEQENSNYTPPNRFGVFFEVDGVGRVKMLFDVYSHFRVKDRGHLNFMVHPLKEKSELKNYIEFEDDEDNITTASDDYSPFNDIKIHLLYGEDFESLSKDEYSFYRYIKKISFDEYMKATEAAKQMQRLYNNIAPMWATALLPSIYFFTSNGVSLIDPPYTDEARTKRKYYDINGKKLKTSRDFYRYRYNFELLMNQTWDPEQYPKIMNFPYEKKIYDEQTF